MNTSLQSGFNFLLSRSALHLIGEEGKGEGGLHHRILFTRAPPSLHLLSLLVVFSRVRSFLKKSPVYPVGAVKRRAAVCLSGFRTAGGKNSKCYPKKKKMKMPLIYVDFFLLSCLSNRFSLSQGLVRWVLMPPPPPPNGARSRHTGPLFSSYHTSVCRAARVPPTGE